MQLRNLNINIERHGRTVFIIAAAAVVAFFLYMSDRLIDDLAQQERERMEIWAGATRELVNQASAEMEPSEALSANLDFLLSIIERNTNIPVLLTDDDGNILQFRNFTLPDADDTGIVIDDLSQANKKYLSVKLASLAGSSNVIDIVLSQGEVQHLYYEDSTLLRRLNYYPYIQLAVMLAFIVVVYLAVLSTKKAEQNRVWVGLSKETAHQLGTPISSLMAWMELLPDMGIDSDTVGEMNKDVQRLSTIASRFSKIGSVPQMEAADINKIVCNATSYMQTRVSPKVNFTTYFASCQMMAMTCPPLFEWVMENLIKNAVDAMEGNGALTVATTCERNTAIIDVADTGKGISKKHFNTIFRPGYTTKKRGWGLGLALAKRIIEDYHHGRIYVKSSTPGHGTTFRIEVPLIANN